MILHLHKEDFKKAIILAADSFGIEPIYVEKDYWVTYALYMIFNSEIGNDTVFKGGTALSKCYHFIERFSEDIDLVVLRREGETDNKLKSKLKAISTVVEKDLPEVAIDEITRKMGMNRKTAHSYAMEFKGNYGQVRDMIILESTWLGYFEPYTTKSICSFVGRMMIENGQQNIAEDYGLLPFELSVLEPIRTICEKIMSLVRFSYTEDPMDDLKKKVRHTYDLHQLLAQSEFSEFFHSSAFDTMLLKVGNDDVASFKNNNKWLAKHPADALIFKDLENVWNEMKPIYSTHFKSLVYGTLPDETAVLETLKMIRERLKTISWTIIVDKDK